MGKLFVGKTIITKEPRIAINPELPKIILKHLNHLVGWQTIFIIEIVGNRFLGVDKSYYKNCGTEECEAFNEEKIWWVGH